MDETAAPLSPVVQPLQVGYQPAAGTVIGAIPVVPQPHHYGLSYEPVFVDHLSRHTGQQIGVVTTAGRVEGILSGVAVDHIQLNAGGKALHMRIAQIVYFEGLPITYEHPANGGLHP
ncbi:hypothetical protein DNH61_18845 [Paenibacillus sambharensis]|uniref:DUF2642 domain-containing protein n=1 Tax=Paenibacillus sambharensis TaxID=1803190 RepID=A0A2W1L8I3_9BACL|nr:DUF2642 domain-containing protein [Paenibacillus sambharensis]PZD94450.1 hypothetical protein DNH61_18845 [Paenibacillus sambharensis]